MSIYCLNCWWACTFYNIFKNFVNKKFLYLSLEYTLNSDGHSANFGFFGALSSIKLEFDFFIEGYRRRLFSSITLYIFFTKYVFSKKFFTFLGHLGTTFWQPNHLGTQKLIKLRLKCCLIWWDWRLRNIDLVTQRFKY